MAKKKAAIKKRTAASFRLDPAVHDRLRRHATLRQMSNTELLTNIIDELDGSARGYATEVHLECAALACISALDLLGPSNSSPEQIAEAVSRLERVLELLVKGQVS